MDKVSFYAPIFCFLCDWCLVNCKKIKVHLTKLIVPQLLKMVKGKAVPLQAWGGPEGSRKLSLPDFMTTPHYCGKIVSLKHRPPLPPGNTPGTNFC